VNDVRGGRYLNNPILTDKGIRDTLADLIRLVGTSPSGIGYTIERAQVIAKDNKYQLIDLLCVDFIVFICSLDRISIIEIKIFPIFLNSFHYIQYLGNNSYHSIVRTACGGANAELRSTPTLVPAAGGANQRWSGIPPFGPDSAPLVGGNDEPLITYLFKYCKASNIVMVTVQLANVHHFHQVGGSAQLRIGLPEEHLGGADTAPHVVNRQQCKDGLFVWAERWLKPLTARREQREDDRATQE